MRTPPLAACAGSYPSILPPPRQAEAVYRGMTLVAMLLLLASLWVF